MLVSLMAVLVAVIVSVNGQHLQQFDEDFTNSMEKRQMRNALVRFGRSAGMRNALVRFGKRAPTLSDLADEIKRNGAPQPFVRFGRSLGRPIDHSMQDFASFQQVDY